MNLEQMLQKARRLEARRAQIELELESQKAKADDLWQQVEQAFGTSDRNACEDALRAEGARLERIEAELSKALEEMKV